MAETLLTATSEVAPADGTQELRSKKRKSLESRALPSKRDDKDKDKSAKRRKKERDHVDEEPECEQNVPSARAALMNGARVVASHDQKKTKGMKPRIEKDEGIEAVDKPPTTDHYTQGPQGFRSVQEEDDPESKALRKAEKRRLKEHKRNQTKGRLVQEVNEPLHAESSSENTALNQVEVVEKDGTLLPSVEPAGGEEKSGKAKRKELKSMKKSKKNGAKTSGDVDKAVHTQADASTLHASPTNGLLSTAAYVASPELAAVSQTQIDTYLSSNFVTVSTSPQITSLRPIFEFQYLPEDVRRDPTPFTKFKSPTPIQSAAWPYLFSGQDVIGVAETGSGKTLAFGVPCVRRLSTMDWKRSKNSSPARAVIVSPTRELAVQIYDQLTVLTKNSDLNPVCVYGGVPKDPQRLALKSSQIIVATPGRLNDLISEGAATLSSVDYLVLDEADRMLDKGFEEDIRKIISACAPGSQRQTLMFTATWPPSVRTLAESFMRSPVKIAIGDNPTGELRANARIEQRVEVLDANPRSKETRLFQLIREFQSGKNAKDRILVFALYKKEAVRVEASLRSRNLSVAGIHGDLSQERRTAALEGFKRGTTTILVATDVAARGLDIPAVKAVINVTFPLTVEDYVHRIGRTGRAGAHGVAVTLFTQHDKANSGALINVLKAAGQKVPEELVKFGTTVKKKEHAAYGAFYKEPVEGQKAKKIKFDG